MDKNLICEVLLAQRAVLYEFRKQTQLNRSDIETMIMFNNDSVLSAYEVRTFFKHTNPQQVLTTIKKLVKLKVIQRLTYGTKGKPSLYILTENGKPLLNQYFDAFKLYLQSSS